MKNDSDKIENGNSMYLPGRSVYVLCSIFIQSTSLHTIFHLHFTDFLIIIVKNFALKKREVGNP